MCRLIFLDRHSLYKTVIFQFLLQFAIRLENAARISICVRMFCVGITCMCSLCHSLCVFDHWIMLDIDYCLKRYHERFGSVDRWKNAVTESWENQKTLLSIRSNLFGFERVKCASENLQLLICSQPIKWCFFSIKGISTSTTQFINSLRLHFLRTLFLQYARICLRFRCN